MKNFFKIRDKIVHDVLYESDIINKKLNKDDFYVFYNLHDIDYLITDHSINKDVKIHYEQYVNIIVT